MKLLFDHNVPRYLAPVFSPHHAELAYLQGWQELTNGKLLQVAEEAGFDMLITLDRGLVHQQSLSGRRIAVGVLIPRGQSKGSMISAAKALSAALGEGVPAGTVVVGVGD